MSLPTVTKGEANADSDILPGCRPKRHCCSANAEHKELKEHETVKKTFLGKEWGFDCQALCGKIDYHRERLWKKSLRKVGVPQFLRIMTLRQRQASV